MPIDPRNLVAGLGESSSESESASSKLIGSVVESSFLIRVTLPEMLMGVSIWYLASPVECAAAHPGMLRVMNGDRVMDLYTQQVKDDMHCTPSVIAARWQPSASTWHHAKPRRVRCAFEWS